MSMRIRRTGTGRLRGWGGVSAMAAACAVTAAAVLLPLAGASPGAGHRAAVQEPASMAAAPFAPADTCQDPEASLAPSGLDGPTIERIRKAGKLVAGVDQNSFKWGYRNPDGHLDGFDIDLVKAIAKDILGREDLVIYRAIPTSQRIPALQEGRVDIVVRTMTINCKRLEDVAFSTAYFEAGQQVLAPKGSSITGYDASLSSGASARPPVPRRRRRSGPSRTVRWRCRCPTSWTAWCGSSWARSTGSSPTTPSPPARRRRTPRCSWSARPSPASSTGWP